MSNRDGDIEVLEGLEPIRRRPAMYVGDPRDPAVLVCIVVETLCIAGEQIVTGRATRATVTLADDAVTVEDDGEGLSVEIERDGRRRAEHLASVLYACRLEKAVPGLGERFCSIGIVLTNALSEFFELDFVTNGERWHQRYERSRKVTELTCTGPTARRGTRFRFRPDDAILTGGPIDATALRDRIHEYEELRGHVIVEDRRSRP